MHHIIEGGGLWRLLTGLSFLGFSTAQRPPSRRCLQAACSFWPASSCAQAGFSPTTHIMKTRTSGTEPDRYRRPSVHFRQTVARKQSMEVIKGGGWSCRLHYWVWRQKPCDHMHCHWRSTIRKRRGLILWTSKTNDVFSSSPQCSSQGSSIKNNLLNIIASLNKVKHQMVFVEWNKNILLCLLGQKAGLICDV